ncbi:hypothetical protein KC887_02800 [Candidatus Kaiserbacteria bacterium]|nr:hypothetical protein [Candidatus Kaiserbacteria bacterium]
MLKILILQEPDIEVRPRGFNISIVDNDDLEIIVQNDAIPKLTTQLIAYQQDPAYQKAYLEAKAVFDAEFDANYKEGD